MLGDINSCMSMMLVHFSSDSELLIIQGLSQGYQIPFRSLHLTIFKPHIHVPSIREQQVRDVATQLRMSKIPADFGIVYFKAIRRTLPSKLRCFLCDSQYFCLHLG